MLVVGADLSSYSIAFAVLGDNTAMMKKITYPHKDRKDRYAVCRWLHEISESFLQHLAPTAVFIEEPVVAGARNIRSSLLIAQVCGSLLSAAGMERVYLVPVSSWKKAVVGHGGAGKPVVASYLSESHPALSAHCGDDQDLIDACCIALHGRGLLARVDDIRSGLLGESQAS